MQYRNALVALAVLAFGATAAHAQQPQSQKPLVPAAKQAAAPTTMRAQQPSAKTPTAAVRSAADTTKKQSKVATKPATKAATKPAMDAAMKPATKSTKHVASTRKRAKTHASASKAKHDSTTASPAKKAP